MFGNPMERPARGLARVRLPTRRRQAQLEELDLLGRTPLIHATVFRAAEAVVWLAHKGAKLACGAQSCGWGLCLEPCICLGGILKRKRSRRRFSHLEYCLS